VSYDAHIIRASDWSAASESPIPLDEWSAAASAAGLVSIRTPGYFFARGVRVDGEDASFEWEEGEVTVQSPDHSTLLKDARAAPGTPGHVVVHRRTTRARRTSADTRGRELS